MDLEKLWVKDPNKKGNPPSVSLTLMVVSFSLLVLAGSLEVFEVTKGTGPFMELCISAFALYFGRRLSFAGKEYGPEKAEKIKEKVE